MRTMFDGIHASAQPAAGDLYAGYVDGRWPDAAAIAERFPGKPVVRIASSPDTNDGVVGDGPPDNGTWPEWVAWTARRRAAGADPTMYTNASNWSAGIAAFQDAGVAAPHWWIAHYDGDPAIPAGAVAKQYASNASYDTSSVADYWPGVDAAPATTPTPPATQPATDLEDDMPYYPISVGPDPHTPDTAPYACGGASWPAGRPHVLQILADPGVWQDADGAGQFRLVFSQMSGPDVAATAVGKPAESIAVELADVKGLNPAACRGVTITRPDGATWPWYGHAE